VVPVEQQGAALAAFVRGVSDGAPWSQVKAWIESGKVFVNHQRVTDAGHRLAAADVVVLRMAAPRARDVDEKSVRIVFDDSQVAVIDKPSGVSSVPYESRETGTAMDLLRDAWRRKGLAATSVALFVVHRIDKDTSGLLAFAKTKKAERALAMQFRAHTVARRYLCVAHGQVRAMRLENRLVEDRGDGLRGVSRFVGQGKLAITHVSPLRALAGATLCQVRLETGKTHQIRIHLAAQGHPLVGERVYIRDLEQAGGRIIEAPRLMLHAETLGFAHPTTGEQISLEARPPADFAAMLERLERG
jgi:23S rRNA pseudouridine1911/1915/1917 synthase